MGDLPGRALALPPKQLPHHQAHPQPRPISLLLEHMGPGQKSPALISLPMAPHETISSLKLRVRSSSKVKLPPFWVTRVLMSTGSVGAVRKAMLIVS